jgi:bilirubin oxidase
MLPFDVIGSDCGKCLFLASHGMSTDVCAGLFSSPIESSFIALSMGERYELVVDFSNYQNRNITLRNGRGLGENVDYPATDIVMRFVVGGSSSEWGSSVPQTLRYNEPVAPSASNAKDFTFERSGGDWVINGVGFRDVENRILTKPERGTYETWALHNGAGGGTHPVHIHLVDFKVISRTGGRNEVADYESAGWKDVVWLAAGESVQVIARYAPWDGIYMFHCHNLVHEDNE